MRHLRHPSSIAHYHGSDEDTLGAEKWNCYERLGFGTLPKTSKIMHFHFFLPKLCWFPYIHPKLWSSVLTGGRKFPLDMACYSINFKRWRRSGSPKFVCNHGFMETRFLEMLNTTLEEIEISPDGATEVLFRDFLHYITCESHYFTVMKYQLG